MYLKGQFGVANYEVIIIVFVGPGPQSQLNGPL